MAQRTTLYRKFAISLIVLLGISLLLSTLLSVGESYQASKAALLRLQHEKAANAAVLIGQNLFDIERRIAATAVRASTKDPLTQRGMELRLLAQSSAISAITMIDVKGREALHITHNGGEVLGSGADLSGRESFRGALDNDHRTWRSPVYFRGDRVYLTTAVAVGPPGLGVTEAEIDLEFLLAGISRIRVGDSGHVYAVDAEGRLIAHPDREVLQSDISLATLPQVAEAIGLPTQSRYGDLRAHDQAGHEVLTAYALIPDLNWYVFVEEPLSEAYKPLLAQAVRSALLTLVILVLAVIVGAILVRGMVQPIEALRTGAVQVGSGMLSHRITVDTGDEIEELADEFNRMATYLEESYRTWENLITERTRELAELNERLAESNDKLAHISATDALTGIANRRRFDEALSAEWRRAQRSGQSLAVGLMDVDWFKPYNDHYGHPAGDECLRQVARVLAASICRTGDLVARYGGEEFVFIAPNTSIEGAEVLACSILSALEALALPHEKSAFGRVSISIGIAALIPQSETTESFVAAADAALYRAKQAGRNRVVRG